MQLNQEAYETCLRRYLWECRHARPISTRESLSSLEEAQRAILSERLPQWVTVWHPNLLSRDSREGSTRKYQRVICLESCMAGLTLACELWGAEHPDVVWGLPEEFQRFPILDEYMRYHTTLTSLFEPFTLTDDLDALHWLDRLASPEEKKELELLEDGYYDFEQDEDGLAWLREHGLIERAMAKTREKYGIRPHESLWVYSESVVFAPLFGQGLCEMWKWDGATLAFLEEFSLWFS